MTASPQRHPTSTLPPTLTLTLTLVLVLLAGRLLAPTIAHAEVPNVGGEVQSTIELSVGEPTPFTRASSGRHGSVYSALIRVEVSATEAPVRLSVADGEAAGGRRRGHMVRGDSILKAPLEASAGVGAYKSLDARVDPLLQTWSEPVSAVGATIQLRQRSKGSISTLRSYQKLLLITVTVAGP